MQSFSLQIYYKRMWVCKVYWEFYEHLLFWPLRKSIFWKTIEWDISIEARGVFNDPKQTFINFVLNSFLDKKCFENSQKKHTYKVAYLKKDITEDALPIHFQFFSELRTVCSHKFSGQLLFFGCKNNYLTYWAIRFNRLVSTQVDYLTIRLAHLSWEISTSSLKFGYLQHWQDPTLKLSSKLKYLNLHQLLLA